MSPFQTPKKATPEQALQQLKHFCGYRERCHEEVRERLKALGVWRADQDAIIAKLIEEDYLNEERFARVFAGGKFRVNHWGRNRIKYALMQKRVSPYCIRRGLDEIEEEAYDRLVEKLVREKMEQLDGPLELRRQKTITYLMGRGFEVESIKSVLKHI